MLFYSIGGVVIRTTVAFGVKSVIPMIKGKMILSGVYWGRFCIFKLACTLAVEKDTRITMELFKLFVFIQLYNHNSPVTFL